MTFATIGRPLSTNLLLCLQEFPGRPFKGLDRTSGSRGLLICLCAQDLSRCCPKLSPSSCQPVLSCVKGKGEEENEEEEEEAAKQDA